MDGLKIIRQRRQRKPQKISWKKSSVKTTNKTIQGLLKTAESNKSIIEILRWNISSANYISRRLTSHPQAQGIPSGRDTNGLMHLRCQTFRVSIKLNRRHGVTSFLKRESAKSRRLGLRGGSRTYATQAQETWVQVLCDWSFPEPATYTAHQNFACKPMQCVIVCCYIIRHLKRRGMMYHL